MKENKIKRVRKTKQMKNNVIVLLMLFVQDLSYKKVLLAKLLNSDYVIVADDM